MNLRELKEKYPDVHDWVVQRAKTLKEGKRVEYGSVKIVKLPGNKIIFMAHGLREPEIVPLDREPLVQNAAYSGLFFGEEVSL